MGASAVLIVCDFNAHGGTQTQVLELLASIDRDRIRPLLATLSLDAGLSRRLDALHVQVTNLDLRGSLRPRTLAAVRGLARFIRREKVSLVHGFLLHGNLLAAVCARSARTRYLTSVRNLELWKRPHMVLASRWAHAGAAAVTFNSRHVRDLVAFRERIPRVKAEVIYNGLSEAAVPSEDVVRAAAAWPVAASPRILCLSSLFPKKGLRYLLEAFAILSRTSRDAALVVAGRGPEGGSLEARARAMGLAGRIVFSGYREDARALIAAADLVVLSSIEEGMPNVLIEAMAAGVPQIATAVGGTPEVVEDGVTGYLVPPRDPVLLAARARRLVEDAALRARMGSASRQRFLARFSSARMAREHEALYARILGGGM